MEPKHGGGWKMIVLFKLGDVPRFHVNLGKKRCFVLTPILGNDEI